MEGTSQGTPVGSGCVALLGSHRKGQCTRSQCCWRWVTKGPRSWFRGGVKGTLILRTGWWRIPLSISRGRHSIRHGIGPQENELKDTERWLEARLALVSLRNVSQWLKFPLSYLHSDNIYGETTISQAFEVTTAWKNRCGDYNTMGWVRNRGIAGGESKGAQPREQWRPTQRAVATSWVLENA